MIEFKRWPKTPRLFRDCTITEKIDGTNAAVHVLPLETIDSSAGAAVVDVAGERYAIAAQSRNRLISPDDDNYGFARWVDENAEALAATLGLGTHFGEWWGSGIQRGYGLTKGEKRFSLFNVNRHADVIQHPDRPAGLGVVPVLYRGPFDTVTVHDVVNRLRFVGSYAAEGFDRPEGVVVHHAASNGVFKVLIENDATPKGAREQLTAA